MAGGRGHVSSPFSNFSVVYLYVIFFIASTFLAHKLLVHRNTQAGSIQALDFDNLTVNDGDSVLHSPETFGLNLEKMDKKFKICIYPEEDFDTLLLKNYEDSMEIYAQEQYFFKKLRDSRFLTDNPEEADLIFILISCQRVKFQNETQANIVARVENYVQILIYNYQYWNRTLGADHFYMTCHHDLDLLNNGSTPFLAKNAIQVIHSPSYMKGYMPHKDNLLPEVRLQLACPPDEHELDDINALEVPNARTFDIEKIQLHNPTIEIGVKFCISDDRLQTQILECINNDSVPVIFSSYTDFAIHQHLAKIFNHTEEPHFHELL